MPGHMSPWKEKILEIRKMQLTHVTVLRSLVFLTLISLHLVGCNVSGQKACPVTEPIWIKPPEDSAVGGIPEVGYYYVNVDLSIWASAWWTGQEEDYLRAGEDGIKVGWFRPAGAELEIGGRRIDAEAAPLDTDIPCCYPTQFQATGLYFPAEGCWEVTAKAADSELTFVIWVEP